MLNQTNIDDTSICLPSLFPPELENPEFEDDLEAQEFELYDDNGYGQLESLTQYSDYCDYHVVKTLITADALENPNECTTVVIFGRYAQLAFFRHGKDRTWTKINENCGCIGDILHCKNQFYAINFDGALISFDVTKSGNSTTKLIAPEIPPCIENSCNRYLVLKEKFYKLKDILNYVMIGVRTDFV